MKHFWIKFNYGVEIGANLAYVGHYAATGDLHIKQIAEDEVVHRSHLEKILLELGEKPSELINTPFRLVGNTIKFLCHISPNFLLDFVASSMEIFAIFNYKRLAVMYPQYSNIFIEMAEKEEQHKQYFKR